MAERFRRIRSPISRPDPCGRRRTFRNAAGRKGNRRGDRGEAAVIHGGSMDSWDVIRVLLEEKNEVFLPAAGLSMDPAIRHGEGVVVRAVPETEIRFGDVVLFNRSGQLVAHRVVRVQRGGAGRRFVTKGDRLAAFDHPIPGPAVLGRVVRIKRLNGDLRLDTCRGRWSSRLRAAGSLAMGWACRFFPGKRRPA